MNVAELIAELQKLPGDSQVRVVVECAHDTVQATLGDVDVVACDDGCTHLAGWAANTRFLVALNDCDDEEEEES